MNENTPLIEEPVNRFENHYDDDREFWITIRAALIMFVRAIEKRYKL